EDADDIGSQVHHNVDGGDEHGDRLDDLHVTVGHRVDECLAESRIAEEELDDDHTAGQPSQLDRHDLRDRAEGMGHGMAQDHPLLGHALESGHLDESGVEDLDHRRPHDPHDVGGDDEDEGERRQDQLLGSVPHRFSRWGQGDGGHDLEHRGREDRDQPDADDELGHRGEHEADAGHRLVAPFAAVQGLVDAEADAQWHGDDRGHAHEDEGGADALTQ